VIAVTTASTNTGMAGSSLYSAFGMKSGSP
jgi:hypothetical protein